MRLFTPWKQDQEMCFSLSCSSFSLPALQIDRWNEVEMRRNGTYFPPW